MDARPLSGLIHLILTEKFNEYPTKFMDSKSDLCEWNPVKNLLCFAQDVFNCDSCRLFPISRSGIKQYDGSFPTILAKIKELLEGDYSDKLFETAISFSSSIVCATSDDMLANFPVLLAITKQHFKLYLPFLSWVLFLERNFVVNVVDMESEMFSSGLKMIERVISSYSGSNPPLANRTGVLQFPGMEDLLDSSEPASSAALFLYNAPFCALFPAIMSIGNVKSKFSRKVDILHSNTMLKLLQVKISEASLDDSISFLRIVLFWTNQMMASLRTCQTESSSGAGTSNILEVLFQICVSLVIYILDHILLAIADTAGLKSSRTSSVTRYFQDVIDIIFQHPIMTFSLPEPLCFSILGNNVQDVLSSTEKFHPVDCNILQLLRTVFSFVLSAGKLCNFSSGIHDVCPGLELSAPRNLVEDLVGKFKLSILKRDVELLLPRFYILYFLMQFISPFELLEVMDWMYGRLEGSVSGNTSSFTSAAASVGLYIVDGAFGMIFSYLQQSVNSEFNWFWNRRARTFDVCILLNLYHKTLEFGLSFSLQCADKCLLKIVTAAYGQRFTKPDPDLFPLCTELSRMITNSPIQLLEYCICSPSKIKTKILLQLVEVSPVHMNLFGKIFLDILNNDFSDLVLLKKDGALSPKSNATNKHSKCSFSNDDIMLLLPVALSYLQFIVHKYGKQEKLIRIIAKFYSVMLFDGFSNWKAYIAGDIFQEEYDDLVLTSPEDFHKFCSSSLLGKAITMLRYSLSLRERGTKEERLLGIFDSVYSDRSLFDTHTPGLKNLGSCSYKESLKILDAIAAKISFTKLLLFPVESLTQSSVVQANGKSKEMMMDMESCILDRAKRFMGILVDALDDIIRKNPLKVDSTNASCITDCYPVFRFLEHCILCNIVQLSMDIQIYLRESPTVPFLEQFISSSLLHRFGDPFTLRAIRCILVALSEAKFSSTEILDQLFRNPKFVPTIARSYTCSDSSAFISCGSLLQPIPSILKSLDISLMDQTSRDNKGTSEVSLELQFNNYSSEEIKLEVIKLLRVLYHLKRQQKNFGPGKGNVMNSRELLSLLLSGYGATTTVIDLEISHLMQEIETTEGSYCGSIADMDFLWGGSAMKFSHELTLDGLASSNMEADSTVIEQRRKMFFRENIPVDSKLSVMTVLHFCNDTSSRTAPLLLKRLLEDKFVGYSEVCLPQFMFIL